MSSLTIIIIIVYNHIVVVMDTLQSVQEDTGASLDIVTKDNNLSAAALCLGKKHKCLA